MNWLKKYGSYVSVINEKKYESVYNGTLEINWVNGKRVLDTLNTNYSYGNLGKVLQFALKKTKSDFKSEDAEILILGLGGGDVVLQLKNEFKSKARITAIEIDPIMIEIAINEFNIIPNHRLEILNQDAFNYLKYNTKTHDLIIVDLFYDAIIPEFVFHQTFMDQIFNSLNRSGSVIFNTFILEDSHDLRNQKLVNQLKDKFDIQSYKKQFGHNHLIIAQKK